MILKTSKIGLAFTTIFLFVIYNLNLFYITPALLSATKENSNHGKNETGNKNENSLISKVRSE